MDPIPARGNKFPAPDRSSYNDGPLMMTPLMPLPNSTCVPTRMDPEVKVYHADHAFGLFLFSDKPGSRLRKIVILKEIGNRLWAERT